LSAYCDLELPSEDRAAVRRHLHDCELCAAALDGFKKLSALTAQWSDMQTSSPPWEELAPKLMTALAAACPARPEEVLSASDPKRLHTGGMRTFKPVIEGLEDRYPLSDLLYVAGATMAFTVVEPMCACVRSDSIWSALSRTSPADASFNTAHVGEMDDLSFAMDNAWLSAVA
jgi:hypothetical protein